MAGSLGHAALLFSCGCATGHHVSPWGDRGVPPLAAFVEQPDLDAHVIELERDAAAEGLTIDIALAVVDRESTRFEVRGLSGRGRGGDRLTATRVASPFGVVLALGPSRSPTSPTELVLELDLGSGNALAMPADLDGDGLVDLAVASPSGHLSIFSLAAHGATEIAVTLDSVSGARILEDGGYGLVSRAPAADSAPILPVLERIAMRERGRYVEDSDRVRKWHVRQAALRRAASAPSTEAASLSRLLEIAFHEALGGLGAGAFDEAERRAPRGELAAPYRRALEATRAAAAVSL
ncbi:MAG: hypothetical protein U0271_11615 [Polyangiaceae bacterium]